MLFYATRRLIQTIPVLFLVTVMAFTITMLLPGDPALAILGIEGARDKVAYQDLRRQLGLDEPVPIQYLRWLGRTITGDLGKSALNKQPVNEAILQRLPVTLELGLLSMILSVVVAVPLGIYAAMHYNTVADLITSIIAFAGVAMPGFWLAILLIYLLTLYLSLLPGSGYVPFTVDPVGNLLHIAMPVVVLSFESVALLMRQVRSEMLDVLGQDYVRTARSKGLPDSTVLTRHALRNALLPLATIIGLRVARILGGAVVIENVFALPGLGRLAVQSIFNRDFPVLQAIVLVFALMVLVTNLLTDLLYSFIDPRIRYEP